MPANIRQTSFARAAYTAASRALPVVWQLAAGCGAFLAANAPMFGGLRPLALALAAGVRAPYALSAGAGAAIGYAMYLGTDSAVPYLVAVLAVAVLRAIAGPRRQQFTPFAPAIAGAVAFFIARSVLAVASYAGYTVVLAGAAEALLVLGMTYMLAVFFTTPWQGFAALDSEGRACVLFMMIVVLLCASPYAVGPLHVSRVLAGAVVLASATRGRERVAAVTGVAAALALTAADASAAFAAVGIAAGGLAVGVFVPGQRLAAAMVFCAGGFAGVLAAPVLQDGVFFFAELFAACILFLLIPQRMLMRLPAAPGTPGNRAALATLSGRLEALSGALEAVGETVGAVCERLPKKGESYGDICDAASDAVCRDCPVRTQCWDTMGQDTYDAFNALSTPLRAKGSVDVGDFPPQFAARCVRRDKLACAVNTAYAAYLARRSARSKSEVMRAALTEQYGAMAAALAGLAGEVYTEEVPDRRKIRRVEQLFCEIGAQPLEVNVAENRDSRLHATVRITRLAFTAQEMHALTKEMSDICHRDFALGQCTHAHTTTTIDFYEKALFTPQFAVSSLPAREGVCADAVKTFCDARGDAYALLCDGMGTGKDAAIDGNMAAAFTARLVQAGFGCEEAARLVNVALSLKSEEESGATLDALSINLYTGKAKLFKAGAAPTFLIRHNHVTAHSADSLPIGILGGVVGRTSSFALLPGDTAVLVSDGAVAEGDAWLRRQLAQTAHEEPHQIAEKAAKAARARAKEPDDITVLVIRLV